MKAKTVLKILGIRFSLINKFIDTYFYVVEFMVNSIKMFQVC